MALALLCRRLQEEYSAGLSFRAFIVDHRARQNSSKEAEAVALNLRKLGLYFTHYPHIDGT